jgi:hypothetical protein
MYFFIYLIYSNAELNRRQLESQREQQRTKKKVKSEYITG